MKTFKNAFGWDIEKKPIYDAQGNQIRGYNEITRNDDESLIGVMKSSFHPMTTAEFTDVVERVASIVGAEVVGYEDWLTSATNPGKQRHIITAQIRLTEAVQIIGSRMDGFMTIGVGFDGSRSFFIGHTQEFLRCTNQFGLIIPEFTSRLTRNNLLRVETIVNNISLYKDYEKSLYQSLEDMHKVKVSENLIQDCVDRLLKLSEEERLDRSLISTQKIHKMDDIFASVRTEMSEVGKNALGLFNGITHYTTHIMNERGTEYFGNINGAKGAMNKEAFEFAKSLLV